MKKKIICFIACIGFALSGFAAEGDTTHIQSHDKTHWDWYGDFYDTVSFPAGKDYRRAIMYYTLGCPSGGCSEWDYTTKIEISGDSPNQWFELVRIITPYAGNKNSSWSHTFAIDVTDYQSLFSGDRTIKAHYSGYQDGFTISVRFALIEGTPPRDILAIDQIYHGTFIYGFANDPIENHLVPTDVDILPETDGAMFRLVASGHSFGGNENCAEFCPKWYKLEVNNDQAAQQDVWRDDCGSNVLEAQTGTWIYNRAGWCPGDETKRYDTDVSDFITPGQANTFNVDWENYNYTGGAGFDPQYIIEAQLFQYGSWNFDTDLSIEKIIKPTLDDRQMNVNPVCNNPEITVRNTGANTITEAEFEYWTDGGFQKFTHTWSGTLLPGASTDIVLPSTGRKLYGYRDAAPVFNVEVLGVNGTVGDDYAENNLVKAPFEAPEVYPGSIVLVYKTNSAAQEFSYRLMNDAGNIVYQSGQLSNNTVYNDTLDLDTGCYTLSFRDTDCDGLNFFANTDGNGYIRLHKADPDDFFPPLFTVNSQFGCESQLSFTVGYALSDSVSTLGIKPLAASQQKIWVYPNPSHGNVQFQFPSGDIEGAWIFNQMGQLVQSLPKAGPVAHVTGLARGTYFVKCVTEGAAYTAPFIVQ